MKTFSKEHTKIKTLLTDIAKQARTIKEMEYRLNRQRIFYERIPIASSPELLVFTGSSGYDIVGCIISEKDGTLQVNDM